jgi:hypothetical protein
MALVTCFHSRVRWIRDLSGLALLLFLTGCAAQPSLSQRPNGLGNCASPASSCPRSHRRQPIREHIRISLISE